MSSKPDKNRKTSAPAETSPASSSGPQWWWFAIGLIAALVVVFEVYGPTLHAPFVFDDRYLPFLGPGWDQRPLSDWIAGVRPLLMITYWANYQSSQLEPGSYHVVNVLFHFLNGVLAWLIVRRILEWAKVTGSQNAILSSFCGLLFLLHPVQTESVAYVASRSENQSVFFFLAAFALFVYRRQVAASIPIVIGVLVLFGCAAVTKEHTVVLPALLLLTDYFWNPGFTLEGIKKNWKIYAPMLVGGLGAAVFVARILSSADTAGFGLKDLPWYQYFFTQCRALWIYLRMFIAPYGLNIDHEFAVSRSIVDHGAIVGMIALIAVAVFAWLRRREYPLASYGYFAFLLAMAPTSSVVPIRDLLVERRLYLAFVPLLLILCELLRRIKVNPAALATGLAVILGVSAFATYSRAQVWSDPISLWSDTAAKAPSKARPHFQLAYAYYAEGKCDAAAQEYGRTEALEKPDFSLYIDWGLALDCAGQADAAIQKFQTAARMEKSAHAWSLVAMVHAKRNERDAALAALDDAEKADPRFVVTYIYRGNLLLLSSDFDQAATQFTKALELDRNNQQAAAGLDMARRRVTPTVK